VDTTQGIRGHLQVRVRPFREEDYASIVEIWNRSEPDHAWAVEEARYEDAAWDYDRYARARFVAEGINGTVIGHGYLHHLPDEFHPDKYRLDAVVDPAHRRRGVGGAIYDRLIAELRARGAVAARAGVMRETATDGVRFLERRGFAEVQRGWGSRLDVESVDLARFTGADERVTAQGVTITTLAAERARDPQALHRTHELSVACEQDVPSTDPVTATSFEFFLSYAVHSPNALPDAFFIAKHGDRYVGLSALYRPLALPHVLHQGLTGVLREYRGRGIAMALKLQTVRYARTVGRREIRTWNDLRNRPMLRINEALGFVKQPPWIAFQKALAPEGGS
jgi:GNAT superfamily N-acetyltransferase